MQIESHFVILVYPFKHDLSGRQRDSALRRLNGRWQSWWTRLASDDLEKALDDTYFFLPYVRSMLFPETALLIEGDAIQQVRESGRISQYPLDTLSKQLETDAMLRLRYADEPLGCLHPLRLEFEFKDSAGRIQDQFSVPAQIHWIDVALFPQNSGFLMLRVECTESGISTAKLSDFLYYARQVHRQTIGWTLPTWTRDRPEGRLVWGSRDLIDFLLQGLTDARGLADPNLESFLERVRKGEAVSRYSSTQAGQVYGQTFRHYTYVCLAESTGQPTADESAKGDAAPFASPLERKLYELATCTDTADPVYAPHPNQVKTIMEQGRVALWQNWEALVLHDSVVFMATRPSSFTLHVLPHNVASDYFHLYLIASYQKFRLSRLSGELMRHGATLHRDLEEARGLSEEFVMFRNHYWFPEVTFKPQGIELYRRYQDGLGISTLYRSVSQAVHELGEHLERRAERLNSGLLVLLEVLAFVVLPAEILAHVFGENLRSANAWTYKLLPFAKVYVPISIIVLLPLLVVFGLCFWFLPAWMKRRK
jgi:hypothetical protein